MNLADRHIPVSMDELNLLLSTIGLALNIVTDDSARQALLALQTKLMAIRG